MQTVNRGAIHADRSLMPGLGAFVGNEFNFHQATSNRLIYTMNNEFRQLHWPHAGMTDDIYHLDDAANSAIPSYRLMMTNAFWMTEAQAEALRKRGTVGGVEKVYDHMVNRLTNKVRSAILMVIYHLPRRGTPRRVIRPSKPPFSQRRTCGTWCPIIIS